MVLANASFHSASTLTTAASAAAARLKADSPDVIHLRRRVPSSQADCSIEQLQADLSQANHTIQHLQGHIFFLKRQLAQANTQAHYAQSYAAQQADSHHAMADLPSTYVVPRRDRVRRFDKVTQSIPFFVLLTFSAASFAIALAAAFPHLWPFTQAFLAALASCLFLIIAFSTLGSFILELCFNRAS